MPFLADFLFVVFFALMGIVCFFIAGVCFNEDNGGIGILVFAGGLLCLFAALMGSYFDLGSGNPTKLNLNTGVVYCTEWSGDRNGEHEYLIRNVSENRRYFVKSDKEQLPTGCFLQMENGGLMETTPKPAESPAK